MARKIGFQNRIIGAGSENPEQLLANPKNWRIHPPHQQKALESVLNKVGWVAQVIVNKKTGHLIDGHLRVQTAMRTNQKEIPVLYVELSEAEEDIILASLDPISALAYADTELLKNLMESLDDDPELADLSDVIKTKFHINEMIVDTIPPDEQNLQTEPPIKAIVIKIRDESQTKEVSEGIKKCVTDHPDWKVEVKY
jgi:hypothetical protein